MLEDSMDTKEARRSLEWALSLEYAAPADRNRMLSTAFEEWREAFPDAADAWLRSTDLLDEAEREVLRTGAGIEQ
jgi:hypothetical protein